MENGCVSPRELERRLAEGLPTQIVDVRSPEEYLRGHVPGALNLPLEQLSGRFADLEAHGRVVVVCQSGARAGLACERLAGGSLDVWRLEGGTDAWTREGLGVVGSGNAGRWSLERQVRIVAGALVFIGSLLAMSLSPRWAAVPLLVGGGLVFAGMTNRCGLAILLGRMPWNQN